MRRTAIVATACLFVLLALTSCRKETFEMNMTARLEQPTADSATTKNYLFHNEEWIYWEEGDAIAVYGAVKNDGNSDHYTLLSGANSRFGYFQGTLESNGSQHYAVYPADVIVQNEGNSSSGNQIVYPSTMPYRTTSNASATDPDSSFGQGCFPMVATFWEKDVNGHSDADAIDFHSVNGIVRLQLYSTTPATLQQIKFTSVAKGNITAKAISGLATVKDIHTNAPYLKMEGSGETEKSIAITNINQEIRSNKSLTFYLPLPALSGATGGADERDADYALRMDVTATVNGSVKIFTKTLVAIVRRNCITKMPAVGITGWENGGNAEISLVGEGSMARPFQIYTVKDLRYLRDAFKKATPTINGKTIDANTYFKISRSDIKLTDSTEGSSVTGWKSGIRNFKGILIGGSNSSSIGGYGISNSSNKPLFESISPEGRVEYITLRGRISGNIPVVSNRLQNFAPLCDTNNGIIKGCRNMCNVTVSTANVAGICGYNNGTIEGCSNEADSMRTNAPGDTGRIAGCCVINSATGVIKNFFNIPNSRLNCTRFGHVAFENRGAISECVISTAQDDRSASASGGMICYYNTASGIIKGCYSGGVFRTLGDFSGVAIENRGIIDYCRVDLQLYANRGAGICLRQKGENAWIVNCALDHSSSSLACDTVGGLCCFLYGGNVVNSYSLANITGTRPSSKTGGAVCQIGMTSGTSTSIHAMNIFSSQVKLYDHVTGLAVSTHITHFLKRSLFSYESLNYVYKINDNDSTATVSDADQAAMGLASATNSLRVYLNHWREHPKTYSLNNVEETVFSSNAYGSKTVTPTAGTPFSSTGSYYEWRRLGNARFPSLVNPNVSNGKTAFETNYSAAQQRVVAEIHRIVARAYSRSAMVGRKN
ncbi:MAG: hypothetical protein SPJ13_01395 [Bacteroidales bacterium]|nr:hypothetical protein [Bacteroidales bacterium]